MFKFGSRKDVNTDYKCTIRLLDDTEVLQCDFQREHKGQHLLDYVCNALNLVEKDYFGLRYVDSHKQRHWLDPTRSILKQVKGMDCIVFCFRVKFYPAEPYRLKEEITRYQIFLQLRRDLLHGRLYCSPNDAALLAAYIVQSELGDYDPEDHPGNYVAELKLLLKQTPRCEEKIAEIHQTQLRGQVPAVAEMNFLRKACLLDTYGVDPHPVKDHKSNQLFLGVNHTGILTFQGSRKTHHFKWQDIQKINYEGKMFIIHLLFNEDSRTKKKHLVGFKCPTQAACHHLWRCAVEQRYFFTMPSATDIPTVTTGGGLFSRGSKFRYSGRVEKEVLEDTKGIKRDQPQFQRSLTRTASFRRKSDTYLNSPTSSAPEIEDGYSSLRYANHSTPVGMVVPVIDSNESAIQDDTYPSPSIASLPSDVLEPVDEEESPSPVLIVPATLDIVEEISPVESVAPTPTAETSSIPLEPPKLIPSTPATTTPEVEYCPAPTLMPLNEELVPSPDVKFSKNKLSFATPPPHQPHINAMRVLVIACLLVLLLLSCLLVLVMESDSPLFGDVRKLPEVVTLRRDYYEPAKDYVLDRINLVFKK